MKRSVSEEIKSIYNLDRQNAKIYALSPGNVSKYDFLTSKYVLPKKDLLKVTALKRFECSPLGQELKAQASAAEKQYQKSDKVFESNKKKEKI